MQQIQGATSSKLVPAIVWEGVSEREIIAVAQAESALLARRQQQPNDYQNRQQSWALSEQLAAQSAKRWD